MHILQSFLAVMIKNKKTLFLVVIFASLVCVAPVISRASVELGIVELSPRGELGGFAVPASGCGDPGFPPCCTNVAYTIYDPNCGDCPAGTSPTWYWNGSGWELQCRPISDIYNLDALPVSPPLASYSIGDTLNFSPAHVRNISGYQALGYRLRSDIMRGGVYIGTPIDTDRPDLAAGAQDVAQVQHRFLTGGQHYFLTRIFTAGQYSTYADSDVTDNAEVGPNFNVTDFAPTANLHVTIQDTGGTSRETGGNVAAVVIAHDEQITQVRWWSNRAESCDETSIVATTGFTTGIGSSTPPIGTDTTVNTPSFGSSLTFSIRCVGSGGTVDESVTVTRQVPPPAVAATPDVQPLTVAAIVPQLGGTPISGTFTGVVLNLKNLATPSDVPVRLEVDYDMDGFPEESDDITVAPITGKGSAPIAMTIPLPGITAGLSQFRFIADIADTLGEDAADRVNNTSLWHAFTVYPTMVTPDPLPIIDFTSEVNNTPDPLLDSAVTRDINFGDSLELKWDATNATICEAMAGAVGMPDEFQTGGIISGTDSVTPPAAGTSDTFIIKCSNAFGDTTAAITINTIMPTITPPPQIDFKWRIISTPQLSWISGDGAINQGQQIEISWDAPGASSCTALDGSALPEPFSTANAFNGIDSTITEPSPASTQRFSISCNFPTDPNFPAAFEIYTRPGGDARAELAYRPREFGDSTNITSLPGYFAGNITRLTVHQTARFEGRCLDGFSEAALSISSPNSFSGSPVTLSTVNVNGINYSGGIANLVESRLATPPGDPTAGGSAIVRVDCNQLLGGNDDDASTELRRQDNPDMIARLYTPIDVCTSLNTNPVTGVCDNLKMRFRVDNEAGAGGIGGLRNAGGTINPLPTALQIPYEFQWAIATETPIGSGNWLLVDPFDHSQTGVSWSQAAVTSPMSGRVSGQLNQPLPDATNGATALPLQTLSLPLPYNHYKYRFVVNDNALLDLARNNNLLETDFSDNVATDELVSVPPPDARITLTVDGNLVREGETADIRYEIFAIYDMECTLSGPGITLPSFWHRGSLGGSNRTTIGGPVTTAALLNTQDFTMVCDPDIPAFPNFPNQTGKVTVEVIPNLEEI